MAVLKMEALNSSRTLEVSFGTLC